MKYKNFVVIPLFALIISCGGEQKTEKPESHVWQGQVDALEKAKGVEDTLMDSAARQRQAIDENSY